MARDCGRAWPGAMEPHSESRGGLEVGAARVARARDGRFSVRFG
jgi:hypothetical protein